MAVYLSQRWMRQPTGPVDVDWASPFARNLVHFWYGGYDVAQRALRRTLSSTNSSWRGNDTGIGFWPTNPSSPTGINLGSAMPATGLITLSTIFANRTVGQEGYYLIGNDYGDGTAGPCDGIMWDSWPTPINLGGVADGAWPSQLNVTEAQRYVTLHCTYAFASNRFYGKLNRDVALSGSLTVNRSRASQPMYLGGRPLAASNSANAIINMGAVWSRTLSDSEVEWFHENPWQLLRPRTRPIISLGRTIKTFTADTNGAAQGRVEITSAEWANVSQWPWTPRVRVTSAVSPPLELSSRVLSAGANGFAVFTATARNAGQPASGVSIAASSNDTTKATVLVSDALITVGDAAWRANSASMTYSEPGGLSPLGYPVRRFTEGAVTAYHQCGWYSLDLTDIAAGDKVVYIAEVKATNRVGIAQTCYSYPDETVGYAAVLTQSTGAVATTANHGTVNSAVSRDLGNGWWLWMVEYTFAAGSDGAVGPSIALSNSSVANVPSYLGSTSSYMDVGLCGSYVQRVSPSTTTTDASGNQTVLVRGVAAGTAGITVTGNGASVGANVTVTS